MKPGTVLIAVLGWVKLGHRRWKPTPTWVSSTSWENSYPKFLYNNDKEKAMKVRPANALEIAKLLSKKFELKAWLEPV